MKAPGQELTVHDIALDGGEGLSEEPFLSAAEGSFFVSRVNELVVLRPSPDGVQRLPAKVEQLIGKGLHNVVVSLRGLGGLDSAALQTLGQTKEVISRCVGTLRLCDVDPDLAHKLETLGVSDGVSILDDVKAASDDYRTQLAGEPLDPGESTDLTAESSEDPGDWGWGSQDAVEEPSSSGPDVAELLIEDAELARLEKQVKTILLRGKRYISLRLHFSRQITSDDVKVLTRCRDSVAEARGQLALISLQAEVKKWLALLEFDREFLILDDADAAEQAHARHAAGDAPAPQAIPKPQAAPGPPAPIPSVEFTSAPSSGDAEALGQARAELAQAKLELGQLREAVARAEQGQAQAVAKAKELAEAVRRDERRIQELTQAKARAEALANQAQAGTVDSKSDIERLEGEVGKLRQQLDAATDRAAAHAEEIALKLSEQERQVQSQKRELEGKAQEASQLRGEISRLKSIVEVREAAAASTANASDAELASRVRALEEEKARILTEAQEEIERLSREQTLLHEELQSAGEMIERLGKELELT